MSRDKLPGWRQPGPVAGLSDERRGRDRHHWLVEAILQLVDDEGNTEAEILARVLDDYGKTDQQHVGIALHRMVRRGELRLERGRYYIAEEEG